ncbi:hypothetical protein HPB49_007390 [Dermacentor silvarum]|uniref:Uncharacterized protein n=1 Tax=Dermacentor silvarum TaxID=543639 RepID=A0ACB8CJS9_DERSI|nr:hypothetical protein HPB49_007390 [Dermacentor silvarum]
MHLVRRRLNTVLLFLPPVDNDPRLLEKQELQPPSCLPVSCVLRVFTEASRVEPLGTIRKRQRTLSPASSICSNTPTGSEMDEEEMSSESDDSNDSWTTQNEFISEFIMRMMSSAGSTEEKPFACPVPGCKKRYKNVNGIKYHAKNGHKKEAKVKKGHRCHCGKSYKTAQGLRVHSLSQHSGESSQPARFSDFGLRWWRRRPHADIATACRPSSRHVPNPATAPVEPSGHKAGRRVELCFGQCGRLTPCPPLPLGGTATKFCASVQASFHGK